MSSQKEAPVIELKNLCYVYPDGFEALRNVSLKIRQGERIALLGPNGAGKSTLFLNLNGVYTPTSGEILLKGKKVGSKRRELDKLRREVGIVFQNADNQIIASTVYAEVGFGPMNLGLSKKEVRDRVEEALKTMGILDYAQRAPHYLSGGEKKRVAIADIIAMDPEIFIFDEPTAALDPLGAELLEDTLRLLTDSGKTILVSTHMVDFAWKWAGRVVVLDGGEVIGNGSPMKIFRDREVLKRAHLKAPTLLEVTEDLMKSGLFPKDAGFPRDLREFGRLCADLGRG